jgi:hypothetical protein
MTTTGQILTVGVSDLLDEAQRRAEDVGTLKDSMRGMQANQVGALGELVGMRYLQDRGVSYDEVFSTEYDLRLRGHYTDKTLEFKTKERTVSPLESYECTVPVYNHAHQRPDFYFFISLESSGKSNDIRRFTAAHILGMISFANFEKKAKRWNPGDTDTTNNWQPSIECLNVKVLDLTAL